MGIFWVWGQQQPEKLAVQNQKRETGTVCTSQPPGWGGTRTGESRMPRRIRGARDDSGTFEVNGSLASERQEASPGG